VTHFVAVGKIASPAGLRGEVRVIRWTDSTERFGLLREVWIGEDEQAGTRYAIDGVRFTSTGVVLKLEGIGSRSQAEELSGKFVLIPADERIQPATGSYFVDDVVGLNVVTEEGKQVGVICEILRLPSNDLWQVDTGTGVISIPAVKEFIRKVDVPSKTVVIHEIEGLLEP